METNTEKLVLNTAKYKLSIFTEDTCESCHELIEALKNHQIPYQNKSITVDNNNPTQTAQEKMVNGNNRWEFIDAETAQNESGDWYCPVLMLEDVDHQVEYIAAGSQFDTTEEALEILSKNYCK